LLGQAIPDTSIPHEDLVIAIKIWGRMRSGINSMGLTRVHIHFEVDAFLRRWGLDHIDLYKIHGLDPLTLIDETSWALDNMVLSGKARYIGISNQSAWRIAKAN
jgi:aryl-alcohol dehydrogenase-like predicted oxidoreductase